MGFKFFLTLATLGLAAAAESSVVSLFLIGNENPQPLEGSIVAVDEDTTTYSINCAKTVDIDHCAFRAGLLYTAGPTSIEYALNTSYGRRDTVICSMGTISTVCTGMMPTTGTAVAAYTTTLGKGYLSSEGVTITAGATRAATDSSATKTTSSDSSKAANSGDSTSQTARGSASTSTGGMPRITAGPRIALGGAAAALVAAAL
ncbi:hypothetical protein N7509_005887 [Penicillium cosmopolitanum]|uniref:GPI anchored cell wall protein n=1 Tax=Penicillium cosmopolitanum TaxID=1131564 RepID=A0A9X0BAI5_9EURO|nr:uncharacterized protein N7509_005887 [Penicillium cosmopolitanum]KAJ5397774.1 hypothetical protein N7509_005887 [Penicillium cosmopolitanum]